MAEDANQWITLTPELISRLPEEWRALAGRCAAYQASRKTCPESRSREHACVVVMADFMAWAATQIGGMPDPLTEDDRWQAGVLADWLHYKGEPGDEAIIRKLLARDTASAPRIAALEQAVDEARRECLKWKEHHAGKPEREAYWAERAAYFAGFLQPPEQDGSSTSGWEDEEREINELIKDEEFHSARALHATRFLKLAGDSAHVTETGESGS